MRRLLVLFALLMIQACNLRDRVVAPIRLVPMESIGAEHGDGVLLADPQVSSALGNGDRVAIANAAGASAAPMIYDHDGKYRGTLQLGNKTTLQWQSPVFARIGPGDSIWVFDATPRILVFDARFQYARAITLAEPAWDAVILDDSRILLSVASSDRSLPLEIVSASGGVVQRFDDSSAAAIRAPRWVARGPDGTFWSVPTQFARRLEHWSATGVLIGAFRADSSWFQPYDTVATATRATAPQSTVSGIWIDAGNHLWLLGETSDAHWSAGLAADGDGSHSIIQDPDKVFDTMVEVVDAATGRSLATTRFDQYFGAIAGSGVVVRVTDVRSGWKRAELSRVVWNGAP